jgi:hypothetical protein
VSVNCAIRDAAFLPPNLGQKFAAGIHSSWFASKRPEERKLLRSQLDATGANVEAVVVAIKADATEERIAASGGNSDTTWNQRRTRRTHPACLRHGAGDGLEDDGIRVIPEASLKKDLHKFLT